MILKKENKIGIGVVSVSIPLVLLLARPLGVLPYVHSIFSNSVINSIFQTVIFPIWKEQRLQLVEKGVNEFLIVYDLMITGCIFTSLIYVFRIILSFRENYFHFWNTQKLAKISYELMFYKYLFYFVCLLGTVYVFFYVETFDLDREQGRYGLFPDVISLFRQSLIVTSLIIYFVYYFILVLFVSYKWIERREK